MAETLSADELTRKLRVPPHSLPAEQSLLGGLLLDAEAWDRIADLVHEDDFYRKEHRIIFAGIRDLHARGQTADVVTLTEHLERGGRLVEAGGLAYLAELAQDTPGSANIQAYAAIVRERSVLRQLAQVGAEITTFALDPGERSARELLDTAESRVFAIAEQGEADALAFRPIQSLLTRVVDRIESLYASGQAITGLSTGYTDLDRLTSGLQNSDLIVLAGRPSMGKTSLAMNMVEHVALTQKRPVAVFSLEMSAEQLAMRLMSSLGRIDQQRVRTGQLQEHEWPRLASAVSLLNEAPLYIHDLSHGLNPGELRALARRLTREQGKLGLIVVDYLQLMQGGSNADNRTAEISEISRGLKGLARELDIPVIALSQLNRSLESRQDKRPVMSDLRESGAIEQDADLVVFIYRDEVYHTDSRDKGIAEVIIAKQRNGPTGTVRLTFLNQFTRFENYTAGSYEGRA